MDIWSRVSIVPLMIGVCTGWENDWIPEDPFIDCLYRHIEH